MSRELQKDKLDNLIKRCETSKSYGDTICIDPDVVISLIQQYAAEKERADKAEQEVCLLEKKIKDLKNEVNELNEVVNASIESTRLVREALEKLMQYPKEETQ